MVRNTLPNLPLPPPPSGHPPAATEPAHTNLVTALVAPLSSRPHTRPMQDTGAQQGEQAPAAAAPQPPQFMTGGLDGRLVVWDVTGLAGVQ